MPNNQVIDGNKIEQNITVAVNFLTTLPRLIGIKERITVNILVNSNISELLDYLCKEIGDSFIKIKDAIKSNDNKTFGDNIIILINGRTISAYDGLETIIKNNDEITMFIPLGGG